MKSSGEIIDKTESLCPVCMEKIAAQKFKEGNNVYLLKKCELHGEFKTLIWKGSPDIESWIREKIPTTPKKSFVEVDKGCPYDCGLCDNHRQHTCTALIEVTQRCNLNCEFCFASSGEDSFEDPNLEKIKFWYKRLLEAGGPYNIQISGGEPTVRDDLDKIIALGRELGFDFIQLNTNGIRIAENEEYLKRLKKAGLNSVFLQFDGVKDQIHKELRGAELLEKKVQAVKNLSKYDIGTVLVPTIVPGINDNNIGAIVDFAVANIPAVRGVHFQPVSYFGRIPGQREIDDSQRLTLPEVMRKIEEQAQTEINLKSFRPPGCENSLCSFHGNYIYQGNNKLKSVTQNSCCDGPEDAEIGSRKAREFVAAKWQLKENDCDCSSEDTTAVNDCCGDDINSDNEISGDCCGSNKSSLKSFDEIIAELNSFSFSISGMAFQDIWNLDLERLKDCCIHVVSDSGNLIPFCIYNITNVYGRTLYRGK